jgi:hypothetical protein
MFTQSSNFYFILQKNPLHTRIKREPTHKENKIYQKIKFFGGWYKYMENVELALDRYASIAPNLSWW